MSQDDELDDSVTGLDETLMWGSKPLGAGGRMRRRRTSIHPGDALVDDTFSLPSAKVGLMARLWHRLKSWAAPSLVCR